MNSKTLRPIDRRHFIAALGGGTAILGLSACAADANDAAASTNATGGVAAPGETALPGGGSSLPTATVGDPSVVAQVDDRGGSIVPTLTRVGDLLAADASEERMAYAPAVPAPAQRSDQRIVEFDIEVIEGECVVDPDLGVSTLMWGFRIAGDTTSCGSPGPVLRARVGDLARITVTNRRDSLHPHNIDFHAVTGQGGGAAGTTVAPGESATINSRLLYPGAFMYHCAFGDVPEHIAHGMYGMFIVDPETPLPPVDHEWAVMQSEWYLSEADDDGLAVFDRARLELEHPTYVTFNGRTDALTGDNSLQMDVGERARFYMVNEGLNLDANFHPIGSQWDVVYPEAATHPINRVIRGSQSTLVVAGGGTVTELVGYVPSTIILVDHALVRTFYKGCIGLVVVSGDENSIFSAGDDGLAAAVDADHAHAADEVLIPLGAFDPANAATAFTPGQIEVVTGTTVTWRNQDSVFHTVTSGTSNGSVGTPDGVFDSDRIEVDANYSHTFDEPGTFDYYCTPHPWMKGSVVVTS